MASRTIRYVISLLIVDRVGVLRDVTGPVARLGGNIDGISQTVVGGYFTVTLTATFPAARREEDIRSAILGNFSGTEASVVVRPHEAPHAPVASRPPAGAADLYIVTVTGPDRPGVLRTVTAFFAAKGINIEDWYVDFRGRQATQIGELTVPRRLDFKQVQDELRQTLSPLGQSICLQQVNIFRATNEIGPIKHLIGEESHA